MYSSSYSRAKFGLEAREPLHKPKGKSCGYYMRIIFFFSSLIQSLIIVSLVLFLIYGQPEKTAEEKRVKVTELQQADELGAQLGARTAEKAALEAELAKLKTEANKTQIALREKIKVDVNLTVVSPAGEVKTLQSLNAQQKAMITLIETNFTQTVQYLSLERDKAQRERDTHHQDAIILRRENNMLKEQLTTYTRKCKEDFAHSLDGIQSVTRDFLNRITTLFPHQLTFHLTCDSQREQMEKIRSSCTNLSRDVENKFQLYLDKVGNKVSEIQALSSRLEVQNSHLSSDLKKCEQNCEEMEADKSKKQQMHDNQVDINCAQTCVFSFIFLNRILNKL
uniref:Plasmalemma vesicle associated protein b n=1 Tax=Labrus bergylta TaxID=56723 RepID=A0A3Q3GXL8_9LABR